MVNWQLFLVEIVATVDWFYAIYWSFEYAYLGYDVRSFIKRGEKMQYNTLSFELKDSDQVVAYTQMIAELNRQGIPYELNNDSYTLDITIPLNAY